MHTTILAGSGEVPPFRRSTRATAFLTCLVAIFFTGMVFQTQNRAYAFAVPPPPVTVPGLLFTGGAGEGAAGTAIVAGAATPVVVSGAIAAGAAIGAVALAYGTYKAVTWAWHWGSAHTSGYADPPPASASIGLGQTYTLNAGGQYVPFTVANAAEASATYTVAGSSGYSGPYLPITVGTPTGSCGSCNWQLSAWQGGSPIYHLNMAGQYGGASFNQTYDFPLGSSQITEITAVNNNNGDGCAWYVYSCQTLHINPTAAVASAPSGQNVVTTTPKSICSGSGGTVTGTPVTYKGSDTAVPDLVLPACPTGTVRTGAQFPTTSPGRTTTPQPFADWGPTIPSAFADCQTPGGCILVLYRVGHGSTAVPVACNDTALCAGWQANTTRSGTTTRTVKRTADGTDVSERPRTWPNGDTLDCYWGPYLVEVDNCSTVATEPTTEPVDKPVPGGAGAPAPGTDTEGCFPTGWAMLNPLEWVYKPVKCVLIWAFKPDQAVLDEASTRVGSAWSGTAAATATTAVGQVLSPVVALKDDAGPTSCEGPSFVIPQLPTMPHALTLHPLSTCNELTQYLLGIYLPIATALIYLGGFFGGTRSLLRAFGMESDV